MQAHVALVIRPNGDIPFDEVDGGPHPHMEHILGGLVAEGHVIDVNPETGHHRIVSGPRKPSAS
jgi:hypothetical protein